MSKRINSVEPEEVFAAVERIVMRSGVRALSIRTLALEAGVSIGSTYNVVSGGLDGIVEAVNARTLNRMAIHMEEIREYSPEVREDVALRLGRHYVSFVKANASLMEMLLSYSFPESHEESEGYAFSRQRAINSVTPVVALFFQEPGECRKAVMTLWASLQGIASLSASGKLSDTYNAEDLASSLVSRFLGFEKH